MSRCRVGTTSRDGHTTTAYTGWTATGTIWSSPTYTGGHHSLILFFRLLFKVFFICSLTITDTCTQCCCSRSGGTLLSFNFTNFTFPTLVKNEYRYISCSIAMSRSRPTVVRFLNAVYYNSSTKLTITLL